MANDEWHINNDFNTIINEVKNEIKDIDAIYLFGSFARGNHTPKSDYDIAVFVKKFPQNDLEIATNIKCSLFEKVDRPIDIIILDHKDLKHSTPFINELRNNNKKLYGHDILKKRHATVRTTKRIAKNVHKIIT